MMYEMKRGIEDVTFGKIIKTAEDKVGRQIILNFIRETGLWV